MRKIFTAFICVISLNLFSQTYHFDVKIESTSKGGMYTEQENMYTSFFDSGKKSHLRIRNFDGKLLAVVADDEKNIRHLFNVKEQGGSLVFVYINSSKFEDHSQHIVKDVIEVSKVDSLTYKIVGFVDEKRKKKRFTADLILEKSKTKYLHVGVDHSKADEMEEKLAMLLNQDLNYVVRKIKLSYRTGASYKIVNNFQEVNFDLTVPEKLNLKDDSYWGS